jgi:hypothetical protein
MDSRARQIIHILKMIEHERLTLTQAAQVLRVSYRHMRRIYKNYRQEGDHCLIHGLQGRLSNRRIDESTRNEILRCFKENLRYCGPTKAAKELTSLGYDINRETLRKWLLEEGLWKGRSKNHHRRIMRKQHMHFGELLQLGSVRVGRFGKRAAGCSLLYFIDDATKVTVSSLVSKPTVRAAMCLLGRWISKYGIPMSICCSSTLLFKKSGKVLGTEEKRSVKRGRLLITAFSRACDRLGIETIVKEQKHERKNLQQHLENYKKQLLKKLGTASITSLENVRQIVDNGFIDEMNKTLAESPARLQDFHVQLEKEDNLNSVLCFSCNKIVSGNLLVRYKTRLFRITDGGMPFPSPYIQVRLSEWLDGSVHVYCGKYELSLAEIVH